MDRRIAFILLAMPLIAPVDALTAASKSPKLTKCDGKQRRPANPYGSILPTVDAQAGTSIPAAQATGRSSVDVFSDSAPKPPKPVNPGAKPELIPPISSATPLTAYRSC